MMSKFILFFVIFVEGKYIKNFFKSSIKRFEIKIIIKKNEPRTICGEVRKRIHIFKRISNAINHHGLYGCIADKMYAEAHLKLAFLRQSCS